MKATRWRIETMRIEYSYGSFHPTAGARLLYTWSVPKILTKKGEFLLPSEIKKNQTANTEVCTDIIYRSIFIQRFWFSGDNKSKRGEEYGPEYCSEECQ
jgi:hypothetical protein